jgi:hypothetical protein
MLGSSWLPWKKTSTSGRGAEIPGRLSRKQGPQEVAAFGWAQEYQMEKSGRQTWLHSLLACLNYLIEPAFLKH